MPAPGETTVLPAAVEREWSRVGVGGSAAVIGLFVGISAFWFGLLVVTPLIGVGQFALWTVTFAALVVFMVGCPLGAWLVYRRRVMYYTLLDGQLVRRASAGDAWAPVLSLRGVEHIRIRSSELGGVIVQLSGSHSFETVGPLTNQDAGTFAEAARHAIVACGSAPKLIDERIHVEHRTLGELRQMHHEDGSGPRA